MCEIICYLRISSAGVSRVSSARAIARQRGGVPAPWTYCPIFVLLSCFLFFFFFLILPLSVFPNRESGALISDCVFSRLRLPPLRLGPKIRKKMRKNTDLTFWTTVEPCEIIVPCTVSHSPALDFLPSSIVLLYVTSCCLHTASTLFKCIYLLLTLGFDLTRVIWRMADKLPSVPSVIP